MLVQLWQWQGLVLLWLKDNSLLELGKCPFFFFFLPRPLQLSPPPRRSARPSPFGWEGAHTEDTEVSAVAEK